MESIRKDYITLCLTLIMATTLSLQEVSAQVAQEGMTTKNSQLQLSPNFQKQRDNNWYGAWSLGISGQTYSDQLDDQTFASVGLGIRAGVSLLQDLEFESGLSIVARSGFSQSRFGKDSLNDGINVHEALLKYTPTHFLSLDAGIIGQRHIGSELLVSSRPFPGVRQTLSHNISNYRFGLTAQQAIPTSRSLNSQTRSEKESTPSFLTESVFVEYQNRVNRNIRLRASATQFRFRNLPTNVAYESRLLGNTVPHSTPATSEFIFDYEGYLYGIDGDFNVTRDFAVDFRLNLLENTKAPSAFNRGYLIETGLSFGILRQTLRASAMRFFNESDSSIAYYNNSRLGHNNREGYSVGIQALINNRVRISSYFTDSDVINPNLVTTRQQHLTLALETVYADF